MTTTTYGVTGLTCGHCVHAVTEEVARLPGAGDVSVRLVAGGVSTVSVTSGTAPTREQVAAALDEAGDYRLADSS